MKRITIGYDNVTFFLLIPQQYSFGSSILFMPRKLRAAYAASFVFGFLEQKLREKIVEEFVISAIFLRNTQYIPALF